MSKYESCESRPNVDRDGLTTEAYCDIADDAVTDHIKTALTFVPSPLARERLILKICVMTANKPLKRRLQDVQTRMTFLWDFNALLRTPTEEHRKRKTVRLEFGSRLECQSCSVTVTVIVTCDHDSHLWSWQTITRPIYGYFIRSNFSKRELYVESSVSIITVLKIWSRRELGLTLFTTLFSA
jgi:hypothetical protein